MSSPIEEAVATPAIDDSSCVRCHSTLRIEVRADPRPGRPDDQLVVYRCTHCGFDVRVHRNVNLVRRFRRKNVRRVRPDGRPAG